MRLLSKQNLIDRPRKKLQGLVNDAVFHKIISDSGWLFCANSLGSVLVFFQNIIIARHLGVHTYGSFAIIANITTMAYALISFRITEFVVKFSAEALATKQPERLAGIIKLAYTLDTICALAAMMFTWLIAEITAAWFLKDAGQAQFIRVYSLSLAVTAATPVSLGLLQVFDHFKTIAAVSFAQKAISTTIILILSLQGLDLQILILALLSANTLYAIMIHGSAARCITVRLPTSWWRMPIGSIWPQRRAMANFLLSTNISATLSLVTKDSDNLWLGFFRSATEVGYYKLALALVGIIMMPVAPLVQTFYPELARSASLERWNELRSLLRRGSKLAAVYILPVVVVAIVLAPVLITTLYGETFRPAYYALVLLLPGLAFANIFFWTRSALLALGRPDYATQINLLIAVIKVLGAVVLVSRLGYIGNAIVLSGLYFLGISLSLQKISTLITAREQPKRNHGYGDRPDTPEHYHRS